MTKYFAKNVVRGQKVICAGSLDDLVAAVRSAGVGPWYVHNEKSVLGRIVDGVYHPNPSNRV